MSEKVVKDGESLGTTAEVGVDTPSTVECQSDIESDVKSESDDFEY